MELDPVDVIKSKIEELERQIIAKKGEIDSILLTRQKYNDPKLKFFQWAPIDAIEQVLQEHGGRMKRDELTDILVEGGLTTGRKRKESNIRISLEKNIRSKRLKEVGDYISLPKK